MVIEKGLSMLNLKNNFFIEIVSPGEAVQTTKNGHFSYWKGFSHISVFTILPEIIDGPYFYRCYLDEINAVFGI